MTTQVNTLRISNSINELKNKLAKLESTYELGMAAFSKDVLTCEKLFEKYGITHLEADTFIDEHYNFKMVEKTFEMSAAKANNLEKALKALNVGFRTNVFNPSQYRGTSLGNNAPKIRISYFFNNN